MENKKLTHGSAIIAVLITIAVLTIVSLTVMRSATLFYELALQRVSQLRINLAHQALSNYGIAYCKSIDPSKHKKKYEQAFSHWPLNMGPYEGIVRILTEDLRFTIETVLIKDGREVRKETCILTKKETGWFLS